MTTKKWAEVRSQLVLSGEEEAAADNRRALRDALGLARIRTDREVTQVELAVRLDRSQGNISELERRSDVYLSSLREYVEALGGELEINAVFDGKRHPIAPQDRWRGTR